MNNMSIDEEINTELCKGYAALGPETGVRAVTEIRYLDSVIANDASKIGDSSVCQTYNFKTSLTPVDVIKNLMKALQTLGHVSILVCASSAYCIRVWKAPKSTELLFAVMVDISTYSYSVADRSLTDVDCCIASHIDNAPLILDVVKKQATEAVSSVVKWCWKSSRMEYFEFLVRDVGVLHEELYPWMAPYGGARNLGNDFLRSDSSVLIIIGPPGTGKTTWICNFLTSNKLGCTLSYDESVLASDEFYVNFLSSKSDVLIVEDADSLLKPRDENKTMSKILTTSDGIVKVPHKKLILTSNLDSMSSIDSALLRSGRCFAVVKSRRLTEQEASLAAAAIGVPDPHKACTVAALWHSGDELPGPHASFDNSRVGFSV